MSLPGDIKTEDRDEIALVIRATRLRGKLGCESRSGEGARRSGIVGELTLSTGVGGRDTG
jgi:hypothetical protein